MKKLGLLIITIFSISMLQASSLDAFDYKEKESKYDTVSFKTSAVCKMCKERIEHDMSFEKGVKSVDLELETQVVTIVYRKDKTTEKNLQVAVTKIGYDADEMPGDEKAHDRLPACCKKDVDPH